MDWFKSLETFRWDLVGSVLTAVAGAVWTVYTFAHERREDRKWKQVQFLLELNQKFFDNAEIRKCVRKLDDSHQHAELARIFRADRASLSEGEAQLLEEFRNLFQFFDNLAQCRRMSALTLEQIGLFGWYLQKIARTDFLRQYCQSHGFADVIELADSVERAAYRRP